MPSQIILVDIFHDEARNLFVSPKMNAALTCLFMEMRSHLFDRKKVALCIEGIKEENGVAHTAPHYNAMLRQMWPDLAASGVFPRIPIYGTDTRSYLNMDQKLEDHLDFVSSFVMFDEVPKDFVQVFEWIKTGRLPARLVMPPTQKEKGNARYAMAVETTFQTAYIKLAGSLSLSHDYVYVITGAAHTIGMHLRTGWPMKWLIAQASGSSPTDAYRSYMDYNGCAQMILDAKLAGTP